MTVSRSAQGQIEPDFGTAAGGYQHAEVSIQLLCQGPHDQESKAIRASGVKAGWQADAVVPYSYPQ
jgi:hypothetical protein